MKATKIETLTARLFATQIHPRQHSRAIAEEYLEPGIRIRAIERTEPHWATGEVNYRFLASGDGQVWYLYQSSAKPVTQQAAETVSQ